MEYRQLGHSGLKVSALSFGTGTFGGGNEFFQAWGQTDVADARKLLGICQEAGVNLVDTADIYSDGLSEEILGKAIAGKRQEWLISSKATFRMGEGPNNVGSSRYHLIRACEDSLRRLGTDYIDIYHMHGFDAVTPVEETLSTLDQLVRDGKVRYIACSNFSGWHLMKSLNVSERLGWARYVGHQVYYSLIGRDYEWELLPLGLDQKVGALVWSPLGWGRLTGKLHRGKGCPRSAGCTKRRTKDRRFRTNIFTRYWMPLKRWHARRARPFPRSP
jgi:aryl-alcohol dehydrogenase-like predicted oxidoreductase